MSGSQVNGPSESVLGGLGLPKERSYDRNSDFFGNSMVFPGISRGDAAFLNQCVTEQPFS